MLKLVREMPMARSILHGLSSSSSLRSISEVDDRVELSRTNDLDSGSNVPISRASTYELAIRPWMASPHPTPTGPLLVHWSP